MFLCEQIAASVTHNKLRTFLMLLVFFLVVFWGGIYLGNLERNERALDTLGEQLPVTVAIANLGGDKTTGIEITESKLEAFLKLDLSNQRIAAESYCNIGQNTEPGAERISAYLFGSNTDALLYGMGVEFEGEQAGIDGIFSRGEAVCYLNRDFAEGRGIEYEIGDELDINMFRPEYDEFHTVTGFEEITTAKAAVGGFFTVQSDTVQEVSIDLICPTGWMTQQYHEAGEKMYYTSAAGEVSNPLKLNELKAQAKELNFTQINPSNPGERFGSALVIDDQLYIQTASQLKRNIELLELFALPMFLLILVLNVVIAYFAAMNNRKFILLHRCMGVKRRELVFLTLCENLLFLLSGGILAMILLNWLGLISVSLGCVTLGLCFLANILGALGPVIKMSSVSPIKLYSYID